jgi:hypothetical protein
MNKEAKFFDESKNFINELAQFWGFNVANPLAWNVKFACEFNDRELACLVSPTQLHFNPQTVSENTIFTYLNNVETDIENTKAYIVDYIGKKYVMRMMRMFDKEQNKWVSLLIQKDKDTEETLSMQYIEPELVK